ncbi:EamA domain-containing membrane protein RarD [Faunimonas pinastri]|uniref:EamA domain-containing membrane protein RarD n=1 Tax=Faunimonas pinastri TaxID=1855383 RepID=A0A1H9KM75_9HYPH|nr:DMT family transporter [Faunimonas pinastri]SER00192.1 EamA domain-containing membrane protein RarD [Faunimonas pinastri]
MKSQIDLRAILILLVLCAGWGLNQVAIKITLAGIPPLMQIGGRSLVAVLCLLVWCAVSGKRLFERDGSLPAGLLAGLLFSGEFLFMFFGVAHTTASRSVIFVYLSPFVVVLVGHFVLGERLSRVKLAGLVLAFLGVVLAFSDSLFGAVQGSLPGDLLCIGAAIAWGATTIVVKRSKLRDVGAEKALLYQLAVSATVALGLSLMLGETLNTSSVPAVLPWFLYQSVLVAGISYLIWFTLIQAYPAGLLSSFTFLTPLFGVIFGGWILGEPLTMRLVGALVLVAAGIYLVNRRRPLRARASGASA